MSKPKMRVAGRPGPQRTAATKSEARQAGAALQAKRLRMWTANPYCAHCGRYVLHPGGYELDHIQALDNGGMDVDSNLQILCVDWVDGHKAGCHIEKTKKDLGYALL